MILNYLIIGIIAAILYPAVDKYLPVDEEEERGFRIRRIKQLRKRAKKKESEIRWKNDWILINIFLER